MSLVVNFKSVNLDLLYKKIKLTELAREEALSVAKINFLRQTEEINVFKTDELLENEQRYEQEDRICTAPLPSSWMEYLAIKTRKESAFVARAQCVEKRCRIKEEHASLLRMELLIYNDDVLAIEALYLNELAILNEKRQQFEDAFDKARHTCLNELNHINNLLHKKSTGAMQFKNLSFQAVNSNHQVDQSDEEKMYERLSPANKQWILTKQELSIIASDFIQNAYEIDANIISKESAIVYNAYQEECRAIDLDICAFLYSMVTKSQSEQYLNMNIGHFQLFDRKEAIKNSDDADLEMLNTGNDEYKIDLNRIY